MSSTITDPRERMVKTGNDLLDTIYQLAEYDDFQARVNAISKMDKDDPATVEASKALLDGDDGISTVIKLLELQGRRSTLLREYVTIRQTIEAMLATRADDLP
jgi:hypothetical protein